MVLGRPEHRPVKVIHICFVHHTLPSLKNHSAALSTGIQGCALVWVLVQGWQEGGYLSLPSPHTTCTHRPVSSQITKKRRFNNVQLRHRLSQVGGGDVRVAGRGIVTGPCPPHALFGNTHCCFFNNYICRGILTHVGDMGGGTGLGRGMATYNYPHHKPSSAISSVITKSSSSAS